MKPLILLIGIFIVFGAKANDTLTRAQVYNLSVGDTFDYRTYSYAENPPLDLGTVTDSSVTYSRYAIKQIYFSLDSAEKYIQRVNVFPNPNTFDTIIIKNIVGYEVYLDTAPCFSHADGVISFDSSLLYNSRKTNLIGQGSCNNYPGDELTRFGDGIGVVLSE